MADIRFVVLSDLHFGATNSVLTSLVEAPATDADTGFSARPEIPSPVLTGMVDGLRELTRGQARRPTLILAGDVLDLALSPDQVAATVFGGFARLAFGDDRAVFDPVVHYLPGNHDHHLWETAREDQYVAYTRALPVDQSLAAPWHTTKLAPAAEMPEARSNWLTGLVQRQPGCGHVEVRVSYPNMGLRTPEGDRGLVLSHGHFTESIYTLMSRLKDILYPDQRAGHPPDIEIWEEENFAWIDFFWSTLGRSGAVGTDVGLIYADLTSPSDLDGLVANLTGAMLGKGKGPKIAHPVEHWALKTIFRREVNHVARTERGTPTTALTAKGQQGLAAYLEGPVIDQIGREWGEVPPDMTFVYGHTHKPFVERWPAAGFSSPVRVCNTGGWVVDTAVPAPVQAGVAVLIDDDLHAAALELYRQSPDSEPTPVRILAPATGDEPSPWRDELAARIDPSADVWRSLSVAAAGLVAQRHRLQASTTSLHAAAPSKHHPRSR